MADLVQITILSLYEVEVVQIPTILYEKNVKFNEIIYIEREFVYCAFSSTLIEKIPINSSINFLYYNLVEY
jgi:hypothetical protein